MPDYKGLADIIFSLVRGEQPRKGSLGYEDDSGNYSFYPDITEQSVVWVRVEEGTVETLIEAYNINVPLLPDYPVQVYRVHRDYYIVPDPIALPAYFEESQLPIQTVPPHSHEPEYGLLDFVSTIRLREGLVYVTPPSEGGDGLKVTIEPHFYKKPDGTWGWFDGDTISLSTYLAPTADYHRLALVGVDVTDGSVSVQTNTEVPETTEFTDADHVAFDIENVEPLMFFDLADDTTQIVFNNMRNARMFLQAGGTPLGSGGSGRIVLTWIGL